MIWLGKILEGHILESGVNWSKYGKQIVVYATHSYLTFINIGVLIILSIEKN